MAPERRPVAITASEWIERLGLVPHPEGGYYRETHRSAQTVVVTRRGDAPVLRSAATAIYFLLPGGQVSALHRIAADEVWHFYAGAPLRLSVLAPDGALAQIVLGPDAPHGQRFQSVVPAGHWFGAEVLDGTAWSLVGCTVAPGFDFADFELADRADLLARYPHHAVLIERLAASGRPQ